MGHIFGIALAIAIALPLSAMADGHDISVARGRQVSIVGGCNDCHIEGYNTRGGKINPAKALAGIHVGWQGPWGTTYAVNVRLIIKDVSESDFLHYAKTFTSKPPMPFYNVHAMNEDDLRSLYRYIKSLGNPGQPMPKALPPGVTPTTPYVVIAPPIMPKG